MHCSLAHIEAFGKPRRLGPVAAFLNENKYSTTVLSCQSNSYCIIRMFFSEENIYFTTRLPARLVYRILNGAWPNLFNLLTMEEDHGFCLLMKYELARSATPIVLLCYCRLAFLAVRPKEARTGRF